MVEDFDHSPPCPRSFFLVLSPSLLTSLPLLCLIGSLFSILGAGSGPFAEMSSAVEQQPSIPFQLLELNIISAQDLAPLSKDMRTYAVAWVDPTKKLSTRVDPNGDTDPTWNDKFVYRVDDSFLRSETAAINIEIYAEHWLHQIHVGNVRVLLSNLLPPHLQQRQRLQPAPSLSKSLSTSSRPFSFPTRFVALQVRRPSGRPQGLLNVGISVLDGSIRTMPLYTQLNTSAVAYRDLMGGSENAAAPNLGGTKGSSLYETEIGSETVAEMGSSLAEEPWGILNPTAFAAGGGNDSELDENLRAKLERWRTELPAAYDCDTDGKDKDKKHRRSKTDGGSGFFGCFGDSYGCELSIACGLSPSAKAKNKPKKMQASSSDPNLKRLYSRDRRPATSTDSFDM